MRTREDLYTEVLRLKSENLQLQDTVKELQTKVWKPVSVDLLDHGRIELTQIMGDDLSIVNAARQSFGVRKAVLDKKDEGLINFLMREEHGTPFEMVEFMFNITCPIFVAREWFRHRIGSFNEYSGRYAEMMRETYVPELEDIRTQVGKPGGYTFESLPSHDAEIAQELMTTAYEYVFDTYDTLLQMGVAKELARIVLPVGGYTSFTWKLNLRSLLNFIHLRSDKAALREIRRYSLAIEDLIGPVVPVAYQAFLKHGKEAP